MDAQILTDQRGKRHTPRGGEIGMRLPRDADIEPLIGASNLDPSARQRDESREQHVAVAVRVMTEATESLHDAPGPDTVARATNDRDDASPRSRNGS